ncbi:hypothetical protein [Posidoniimonas corsicana]|uniref:hypothetical protein n=1 Tax=Posidoniimonas corsicana TaxID=1938618 RepID=UPI0011B5639A|nr:hypothetical protein [Posidoniimonas corsicana]
MDLQPATADQLEAIEATANNYCEMWSAIGPPYPCAFAGTRIDIDALDFIEYEAGHHPQGLPGAALIWGNVIAKSELLDWLISDAGELMLGSTRYPSLLIWPMARVLELSHTSTPESGKFYWLLEEVVTKCLIQGGFAEEEDLKLLSLLGPERSQGYCESVVTLLRQHRGDEL